MKKVLMNVAKSFDETYECEDGYVAVYNPVKGRVLYYFNVASQQPLEANVSPEQRDSFVKTGYWRPYNAT